MCIYTSHANNGNATYMGVKKFVNLYIMKSWDGFFPRYRHASSRVGDKAPDGIKPGSIKPFAALVIASRASGKSYTVRDLFVRNDFNKMYDHIIVMSNTLLNGWYQNFINADKLISSSLYSSDLLVKLDSIQDEHRSEYGIYPSALVILDDCVSERVKYSDELMQLFTMGRHKATSIIFISQSPTLVQSVWRQNATHCIMLKMKGLGLDNCIKNFILDLVDQEDVERHAEEYGISPSTRVDVFARKMMTRHLSEKYNAIVVLYEQPGNRLDDYVCCYKAP